MGVRPGKKGRVGLLVVALVGLATVAVVANRPGPERPPVSQTDSSPVSFKTSSPAGPPTSPAKFPLPVSADTVGPKPLPSHQNTHVDGGITLDDQGNVAPDTGLRRLFEYFLTGLGREDMADLRARLAAFLDGQQIPGAIQDQTLAFFDRYLQYRGRLGELSSPDGTVESLRRALTERRNLRREVLGREMADGFFGREEAEDRFVLEMRALEQASGLSPAERQQRQELLLQQLPPEVRRARERTAIAVVQARRAQQLREKGASEAEIWAMRQQLAGAEAADRLAELDKNRQRWNNRVEAYRRERDRILAAELAPEDQQEALGELRNQHFEPHEAKRVIALDRVEANP